MLNNLINKLEKIEEYNSDKTSDESGLTNEEKTKKNGEFQEKLLGVKILFEKYLQTSANDAIKVHNWTKQHDITSDELLNKYNEDNIVYSKKLESIDKSNFTNKRQAEYNNEYTNTVEVFNKIFSRFYAGLVVFYILYFMVYKQNFKNSELWAKIILLLIYPFVILHIFNYINLFGTKIITILGLSFDTPVNDHKYTYERLYMKNPENDKWENKMN